MTPNPKSIFAAVFASAICAGTVGAAVVASTNFDGRIATPAETATNLNWTLNGVQDPGDMTALNASAAAQPLFNANALTQNMFAPGINTGNGNTFWTTSVNLTVAPGSNVTLTDITFDYWSVNGGQNQNVDRRSDFTISLLDPSSVSLDSVDIVDSLSGSAAGVPTVTATFSAPIALTAAGTYTLQIKGGDYLGTDETGNHTAIDNLSINGIVTAVPEPSSALLIGLGLLAVIRRRR